MASAGPEARGAIFTKTEVVEFVLDLVGYTADQPLAKRRLLEPSFGNGDFLFPALERLFESCRIRSGKRASIEELKPALHAVELHGQTFNETRQRLLDFLTERGLTNEQSLVLAASWLHQEDFLLAELPGQFTHVVGNPPYIRQEMIPDDLMAEYRRRYATIFDRADIYVPFIEHSLSSLQPGGTLGFICADRWMKNQYGGPLRRFVAEGFHLRAYVDMVDTAAFHSEVSAYPAIFVIGNEISTVTRLAHRPSIDRPTLTSLAADLTAKRPPTTSTVKEIHGVARGSEPWILESSDQLAVIRRLEKDFPSLEEAGCKVGIGVATGADKVFIAPFAALDVEEDRKLPLAMARDISSGEVNWRGNGVINPFSDSGGLVSLEHYPRLSRYLTKHGAEIKKRHVSKHNPAAWYRTIDRIYPALTYKPKLLIPDIKNDAHIVYEEGRLYPHHNLYFITSDTWDLRALQAVLLSSLTRLFIATYTTKMRGGYLRFQAQYLRRLRVPEWSTVPEEVRHALREAAIQRDISRCNEAVSRMYNLSASERQAIGQNGTT